MISLPDRLRTRPAAALAGVALFALGGGVGAAAMRAVQTPQVMAPAAPVPIAALANLAEPSFGERIVTVRGKVAEVYGDRFVLADAGGRVLVEAGRGRGGSDQPIVAANQIVSVQGGYDEGTLRARYLIAADGSVTALRGPGGGHRRHGPR